ncbi:MAG TPA: hypothetical protein VGJ37_17125 [Pyrinomonadaceae bacterium]|jgi:hypothetical protein
MKRLLLAVPMVMLLVSVAVSQDKPWTEWTKEQADKILNHSAWGQTQTDTDTSEMVYSPTSTPGSSGAAATRADRLSVNASRVSQGAVNQAVTVNYRIRLLSAKPVREAFMRMVSLAQTNVDQQTLDGLQAFVDRDFSSFIIVAVDLDATDRRFSGPALQAFATATIGTLKNKTYLERKDGKRLYLTQYREPINDRLGAKFIFPRVVEGQPFLNADSGTVRFVSEVNNEIKLNVTFKLSEMIYRGQLEY